MKVLKSLLLLSLAMVALQMTLMAQDEEVFETAYEMPRFPGCEMEDMSLDERKACAHKKLMNYIQKDLNYPSEAKENNIGGYVMVSFVVTKDGQIEDPKVIKSLGYGADEEALRVVRSMNDLEDDWIPGVNENGSPVNVRYKLPIQFRMNGG